MECVECKGKGFVLSTNEQGYHEIQKCDSCSGFESDSDAQEYAHYLATADEFISQKEK